MLKESVGERAQTGQICKASLLGQTATREGGETV